MRLVVLFSMCLACVIACGDDGAGDADAGGDGSCRDSVECAPDEGCVGPDDVFCGIPPRQECNDDQACFAGTVCHVVADSCNATGIGSMCDVPCNPGDACGPAMVCNAEGACRALACDDPLYDCRPGQTCGQAPSDPATPVWDLHRGCENILCSDDGGCPDDTVCVNGNCQQGPGVCSPPAA